MGKEANFRIASLLEYLHGSGALIGRPIAPMALDGAPCLWMPLLFMPRSGLVLRTKPSS